MENIKINIMEKDILEELEIKIHQIYAQGRDVEGIVMNDETAKSIFSNISFLPPYAEMAFLTYRGIVIYRTKDVAKNKVIVF